jgi:acetolactate synthase-1/2/3 large subunit
MSEIEKLADEMASAGTTHVFGITGSGASLLLCDRLERRGVEIVRTMFEGSAGIMAGTAGRLTGRPSAAVTIKGPGLANLIPGLAVSAFESFPMVALCEAYPPGSPPSKAHKRLDHATMTRPVVKSACPLTERGPGFADMWRVAQDEVPGPVLLDLAGPIPDWSEPLPVRIAPPGNAAVIDRIAAAKRPVVIAGSLAVRLGWAEALSKLRIPVFTTASAKGAVDEQLPHAAGIFTAVGLQLTPEASLIEAADLVVGLGLRPAELLATKPFVCPAVNIEAVAEIAGCEAFQFCAVTSVDAAGQVFAELGEKSWGIDEVMHCRSRLEHALLEGFLPGRAFRAIEDRFDRRARIVMDTGYFCTIGEHAIRAARSDLCLMSAQGRYMGTGLPMALAAAMCAPAEPTIAVVGDGGIGMYVGELRIAVERKLPLLVVLMSDGRFGSIATRAIKDKLSATSFTPADPSWLKVVDGFGVPVRRAASDEQLRDALQAWRPEDGPGYIEIAFDPDPYERMVAGIR